MSTRAWARLDNASNIFLAARSARDPKVFRLGAELDHEVDPVLLQRALLVHPGQQQQVLDQQAHPAGLPLDPPHVPVQRRRVAGDDVGLRAHPRRPVRAVAAQFQADLPRQLHVERVDAGQQPALEQPAGR